MGSKGGQKLTKTMLEYTLRVMKGKSAIFMAIVIITFVYFYLICMYRFKYRMQNFYYEDPQII